MREILMTSMLLLVVIAVYFQVFEGERGMKRTLADGAVRATESIRRINP